MRFIWEQERCFLVSKIVSDPVFPLRFYIRGAVQWMCFVLAGGSWISSHMLSWKHSWCEMTLCWTAIKINDISIMAYSWYVDNLEQLIIFYLDPTYYSVNTSSFCCCVKLAKQHLPLTNINFYNSQTIGAKFSSQSVINFPKHRHWCSIVSTYITR